MINLMKSDSLDYSSSGTVINDAKLLCSDFTSITFSHVYREVNVKADALARLGLTLLGFWY